jgi:hypothetical protein
MMAQAKQITLGDDFGDVVITANRARVEIHSDGSVVSGQPVKSAFSTVPAYSEPDIPVDLSRLEKAAPGSALKNLIDNAGAIALKFGHAEITYMHLTAAIFESSPEIALFLSPKLKPETMKRLVEKELGMKPKAATENAPLKLSNATAIALAKADWVREKSYKSDRLLPLEALRNMIVQRKVPNNERCTTVDYAAMTFSVHQSVDVGFETRKAIDKIAATLGEVKPTSPPPGIQPT